MIELILEYAAEGGSEPLARRAPREHVVAVVASAGAAHRSQVARIVSAVRAHTAAGFRIDFPSSTPRGSRTAP